MCYAIPGKIDQIVGKTVTVDYFGEKKKAINEIPGLKPGDYVFAQGGYIISKVPASEAEEILATWKDLFFELQDIDLRLSKSDINRGSVDQKLVRLMDRTLEGRILSDQEYLYLLDIENKEDLALLYKTANFIRQKHLKNSCCVHGIIEISNLCSRSCDYCGISTHNQTINRYKMSPEEILDAAEQAIQKYGFKSLVLQSGENAGYSIPELCSIVREIKDRFSVLLFISFGEVGLEALRQFFEAGARGLLMRFETSNPALYKELHNGEQLKSRLEHLEEAGKLGYLIATGSLIGLPGQTHRDILNDIFLAKELKAEMYSFGPFLPSPSTPLASHKPPSAQEVLKVIAVSRLVDPMNAKIAVTTGFETLYANAREEGMMAGANSAMINLTPSIYSRDYVIYPKRAHSDESLSTQIGEALALFRRIGRAPTDLGI